MKHIMLLPIAVTLMALAAPRGVLAQEAARTRAGFWFNGGLGWGTSDCESCAEGERNGAAGVLAVGGTLSQKLLLGASSNAWIRDEDDVRQTLGALTALVRFYPSRTGHFYLAAGLGISSRDVEVDVTGGTLSTSENGSAALIGLGYDFRIGRNVSLTPFANAVGLDFDGEGTGFTQLGLSITVH